MKNLILVLFLLSFAIIFPPAHSLGQYYATGTGSGTVTARYTSSTSQDVTSTTNVAIEWNNEDFEDEGFVHDNVTNNSRIKVIADGKYLIMGCINYYGTTSNYRLAERVTASVNGVAKSFFFDAAYVRASSGANDSGVSFAFILDLSKDDYFEILTKRISDTVGDGVTTAGTNLSVVRL